jgi:hypothetical protein
LGAIQQQRLYDVNICDHRDLIIIIIIMMSYEDQIIDSSLGLAYGDVISLLTTSIVAGSEDADGHVQADGFSDNLVTVALSSSTELPPHFECALFQVVPRLQHTKSKLSKLSRLSSYDPSSPYAKARLGFETREKGSHTKRKAGKRRDKSSAARKRLGNTFELESATPLDTFESDTMTASADAAALFDQEENYTPDTSELRQSVRAQAAEPVAHIPTGSDREAERQSAALAQTNEETERQNFGLPVKFGSYIQLRHVKSGKFLTLKAALVASREHDAMQITLDAGTVDSAFHLMPRYKLRKDGSPVRFNDICVLLNTTHELAIHCSQHHISSHRIVHTDAGRATPTKHYECNASPRQTGWQLKLYSSHSIAASRLPKALRSGDVVRLQHTESSGFLHCEPLQPDSICIRRTMVPDGAPLSEEFHVGQLFRVETENADSGGVTAYNQGVRLKSVATGRYICPNANAMATGERNKSLGTRSDTAIAGGNIHQLTSHIEATESSTFSLERTSFETETSPTDHVNLADSVFLKSKYGWVHTPKETVVEETDRQKEWRKLCGAAYFREVEPVQIEVVCLASGTAVAGDYGSAFALIPATKEELLQCDAAKAIATKTESCVDDLVSMGKWTRLISREMEHSPMAETNSVLDVVSDYIGHNTPRSTQKVLRELMLIESLVKLLKHVTRDYLDASSVDALAQVTASRCYEILVRLVQGYRYNEFIVCSLGFSPYRPAGSWSMLSHLGHSLGAEHLLAVILCHNYNVQQLVQKETIDSIVGIFASNYRHDTTVLQFLTSVCSCNGQQVRKNQMYIATLFMQQEQYRRLLVTVKVSQSNRQIMLSWYLLSGEERSTPLADVLDEGKAEFAEIYEFFLAQIMLFSEMCYGTDIAESNDCISSFFEWPIIEDIFLGMLGYTTDNVQSSGGRLDGGFVMTGRKDTIPTGRRARLSSEICKLLIDRLLTVDGNTTSIRHKVLPWPDVVLEKVATRTGIQLRAENDMDIKMFVGRCLHAALQTRSSTKTVDGANFLRAVLRLCRKLVSLGLYGTDPQLMTESTPDSLYLLTKPLVRLLQLNNDELLSADASSFSDSNTLKKSAYLRAEEQQSGAAALIATKCEILKILFLVMKIEEDYFMKRYVSHLHSAYTNLIGGDYLDSSSNIKFSNPLQSGDSCDQVDQLAKPSASIVDDRSVGDVDAFRESLWEGFVALTEIGHKAFDFESLCSGRSEKRPFTQTLRQLLEVGHPELSNDVLQLATRRYSMTEHLVRNFQRLKLMADVSLASDHQLILKWAAELNMYDATSSVWLRDDNPETIENVVSILTNCSRLCLRPTKDNTAADSYRQEILRLESVHETVLHILASVDDDDGEGTSIFDACCFFLVQFSRENFENAMVVFYSGLYSRIKVNRPVQNSATLAVCLERMAHNNMTIVKQLDTDFVNSVLKINEASPRPEFLQLIASTVHCGQPRKTLCAHVVRSLCKDGRGSPLLFRYEDGKYTIPQVELEAPSQHYLVEEQLPTHNEVTVRTIKNTKLGYEITLASLLCKCW